MGIAIMLCHAGESPLLWRRSSPRKTLCASEFRAAERLQLLEHVDKELSDGNEKAALNLIKDLQANGSIRCFGAARQIPQRIYTPDELRLNGIKTSSLLSPVDTTIVTTARTIQAAALLGGITTWNVFRLSPSQILFTILGLLFLWSFDAIYFNGGLSFLVIDTLAHSFSQKYHNRVVQHEAGHFLIAYLLGILPKGYTLTSLEAWKNEGSLNVQAGTKFVDFEFLQETLNKFSCIALAGVATEYVLYGAAEGGISDIATLDRLLKGLGFTQKKADGQVRWAVLNTVLIVRRHDRARAALAAAMAEGRSVGYCIDVIEETIDWPIFQGTVIERIHVFITYGAFDYFRRFVNCICGSRGTDALLSVEHYCCDRPNPIIQTSLTSLSFCYLQLIYVLIIGGTYYLIVDSSFRYIPGYYLGSVHRYTSIAAVAVGIALFLCTSFSDPGVVNSTNVSQYLSAYPYDHIIFTAKECTTCKIPRTIALAREMRDISWLFSFGELAPNYYGIENSFRALAPHVVQWVVNSFNTQVLIMVFLSVVSLMLAGFFGYHAKICLTNTTTNESFKWEEHLSWERKIKEAEASASSHERSKGFFRRRRSQVEVKKKNKYDKGFVRNVGESHRNSVLDFRNSDVGCCRWRRFSGTRIRFQFGRAPPVSSRLEQTGAVLDAKSNRRKSSGVENGFGGGRKTVLPGGGGPLVENDEETNNEILERLCSLGKIHDGVKMVEVMVRRYQIPDFPSCIKLIRGLVNANLTDKAALVLRLMVMAGGVPDVITYNMLIGGLCRRNLLKYAIDVLDGMSLSGCPPDVVTYNTIIRAMFDNGRFDEAVEFWKDQLRKGCLPYLVTCTILVELVFKHSGLRRALDTMDDLSLLGCYPDLVTYNTLINLSCKHGNYKDTGLAIDGLLSHGLVPNVVSFNIVLHSLSGNGYWDAVDEILLVMDETSNPPSVVTYNILINALCKQDRLSRAIDFLDEMIGHGFSPDIITVNTLLRALCQEEMMEESVQVLLALGGGEEDDDDGHDDSTDSGLCPNVITYNIVVYGLTKLGMMDRAMEVYGHMVESRNQPDDVTYRCLLWGFCNADLVEAAVELLRAIGRNHRCGIRENFYRLLVCRLCEKKEMEGAVDVVQLFSTSRNESLVTGFCSSVMEDLHGAGMIDEAVELKQMLLQRNLLKK
ncbi:hypothetical protein M569_01378 [Genlisea aurea]|uniref:Uncharacterized protein n=1 Tax=Genlisea aurea TaxID=192259 RepID=S8D7I0_9LAMI|nr:hypothetical protein M569_01378 [Genlisea aurea]